jgi:hypothetical protein
VGGKQVAESEAPEYLLFHVEDDRLKRLINRVWQRLPAHDRHVLCELLLQISDGMPDKDPEVLGSAGLIVPSSPMKGCVAQIARNASYSISLYRAKEIESDAACMFVIAHEFAHVVLRHGEMSVLAGFLQGFGPELITPMVIWTRSMNGTKTMPACKPGAGVSKTNFRHIWMPVPKRDAHGGILR